jgi:transcriptional regulator with XRE-family HTH domain
MKKNKGGAPSKYSEKYNEQGRKLCLMGYTDKQLADFFGVAESTINKWKLDYPGFSESLKAGKEIADAEVTASLYERAKGYQHIETKVFCNQGEITTHDVKKIYPPDPISIKYWLNNRQPGVWREKVDTPVESDDEPVSKIQIEVIGANTKN